MGAHRARHGSGRGGLRPVNEILARVTAGPGGAAAIPTQRSAFTIAAAAAVGAGTAAASMTGGFPAIQAPTLGLGDTGTLARIIEPASAATPAVTPATAPAALAGHAPAAAPAAVPTAGPAAAAPTVTLPAPAETGGPAGTVMATDLHQTDAKQIAALSRSVDLGHAAAGQGGAPAAIPAGLPAAGQAVAGTVQAAAGTVQGAVQSVTAGAQSAVNAALSLPANLGGVPVSGLAGSKNAAIALKSAATKLGKPYVWGAVGPNKFDCSGLMLWAYKQAGINLPRTSSQQAKFGTKVAKSDLKPGDMVFFYSPVSHVGFYLGNGKILHASEPGKPVKVSPLNNFPFAGARRV